MPYLDLIKGREKSRPPYLIATIKVILQERHFINFMLMPSLHVTCFCTAKLQYSQVWGKIQRTRGMHLIYMS